MKTRPLGATGLGIGAGAALLAAMCADAASRGESAFSPFSLSASLVLGASASHSDASSGIVLGIIVGTLLSALEGFVFAQLVFLLPDGASKGWGRRLLTGALFGAGVYLLSFQVVGRVFFPWVLGAEQPGWFVGHAFLFGPLLAVMHHLSLRRERERLGLFAHHG